MACPDPVTAPLRCSERSGCHVGGLPGAPEHATTGEPRTCTEGFLYAESLVPFCHALAAGEAADLELADAPADGEVDDGDVFGLAGPCRDDAGETCLLGGLPGLIRFGEGAALVGLQQDCVGGAAEGGLADPGRLGDQEVVADDLDAVPDLVGEGGEADVVVLGQGVLDRDDGDSVGSSR